MAITHRQKISRGGFVVAATAVVATAVLLPFAIFSLVTSLKQPSGIRAYTIGRPAGPSPDHLAVNIDAVGLSELTHTLSIRVSGLQRCSAYCGTTRRIRLYSMGANPELSKGVPPSVYVDVPGDASEIDADLQLPVEGSLASYPFDSYSLYLGVSVATLGSHGQEVSLTRTRQRADLTLSVGEEIPRVDMGPPRPAHPLGLSPPDPYGFTALLTFGRPLYLQIFTILVIILTTLAATYAVLMRPFDQMIQNAGVMVLGMWGVRSLLVGSYPADSTAVDLILIVVVLLLLLMAAIRGLSVLWGLGWGRADASDEHVGDASSP